MMKLKPGTTHTCRHNAQTQLKILPSWVAMQHALTTHCFIKCFWKFSIKIPSNFEYIKSEICLKQRRGRCNVGGPGEYK